MLQQKLISGGFLEGSASGTFDAGTEQAVKAYQASKGLTVDGQVGQQTWGDFNGERNPVGTWMLKGGGGSGGLFGYGGASSFGAAFPFGASSLGDGKGVMAYANGRAQSVNVVSVGNGQFLRADAATAFKNMQAAAASAGISLSATSGFRTMEQQQELYRKYQAGTGALAAAPGYSNHQNGIAMDIGGVSGRGSAADQWLAANSGRFGFKNLPAEAWHYDFVG